MLKKPPDVTKALEDGCLLEHLHTNLELKEEWAARNGEKLSALANKLDQISTFLAVGVSDTGKATGKSAKWAKKTEEVISQQINQHLDPSHACVSISCHEVQNSWIVVVAIRNPGDVTYWDGKAYKAAGTTIDEMKPHEILELRIQLPGLTDFSKQYFKSSYELVLVSDFAERVRRGNHPLEIPHRGESEELAVLQRLGIHERQAARILFGPCMFRLVIYDEHGSPKSNSKEQGLYRLLSPKFRSNCLNAGVEYSDRALKEALSNAVAHAAYFEGDGEILIEIYPSRIAISNLCIKESTYFANRWFSRSHKSVNGLLMEALRIAGLVDELGRGKHIIFSESIKLGHRPPEVVIEKSGRYDRWKLIIHGALESGNYLRVLDRCREIYRDEQKALIAQALELWRDKAVKEIRNFVDGEFARQFADVLGGLEGPLFYDESRDKITLKRWAEVLIGEGKESKVLSPGEEKILYTTLYDYSRQYNDGVVTPKSIREFGGMGNSNSEKALSSSLLSKWEKQRLVEKVGHGK
jgi:predicted HTH transcriptional regulator